MAGLGTQTTISLERLMLFVGLGAFAGSNVEIICAKIELKNSNWRPCCLQEMQMMKALETGQTVDTCSLIN